MSLRKTYVARRADSSLAQFRMRVPTRVVDRVRGRRVILPLGGITITTTIGTVVSFSLRTNDERVIQSRDRAAREALQRVFDAAEAGPQRFDHRQLVALSGDAYRLYVEIYERDPGTSFHWAAHKAFDRAALQGRWSDPPPIIPGVMDESLAGQATATFGDNLTEGINALSPSESPEALEKRFGMLADWVLAQRGIELDQKTREKFLIQVGNASLDAGWRLKRATQGDYTPDPKEARFPAFEKNGGSVPLQTLVDGWWNEAKTVGRTKTTRDAYTGTFETLAAFLKHDDASRITEADVLRFKEHRIASGISAKTVADKDLAALKSVFRWSVSNRKLKGNPAEAVKMLRGKKTRLRSPGFTDDEAIAILTAAANYQGDDLEPVHVADAKRWVPWLAAYSGARVGELAQLRKQDVFQSLGKEKAWLLRITPEAGTVKTKEVREVPIHPHLIDQGWIEFVRSRKEGPLFGDKTRPDGLPVAYEKTMNRLRAWVREIVPDPNVQPFHAWRHRLKTIFRDLRIEQKVAEDIQGWADGESTNAGGGYGEVTLRAKVDAIAAIPRYRVRTLPRVKPQSRTSAPRIEERT